MRNRNTDMVLPVFLVWTIFASAAFGQTNDSCAGAIALFSGVTDTVSTLNATSTNNPPTDCNGYPIGHGVWYTVTTPAYDVRLNLSTCGSSYNTELLVYAGVCGSLGNVVACSTGNNPFGCSSENAGLSFSAPANTTYYILAAVRNRSQGTLNIVANLSTPPTNDMCANAIPLTNGVTDVTNTFDATEFGDPPTDCNGYPIGHGVWYTVTTPAYDVRLNLSTCGSSYNTELLVYAGVCGSLGNVVACSTGNNPFGCSSENAGLSFSAPANTTYYILAAGAYSQSGTLNIVANLSTPPTNDMCANAIPLTNGVTDVTNTFDATEFGDPPTDCNGYPIGHGVWYTVTTPAYDVRLNLSTCGSSYNTELLVYAGVCGSLGNVVACSTGNNPFGCSSENAGLSFSAPANTTYYILAAGAYSQSGTLNIVANLSTPPTNDMCANAIPLTNGVTDVTNTFDATEFGDPPTDCNGYPIGHGVWYTVTTPAYDVRLNLSTCGSSYNTELLVYAGVCGSLGNVVACSTGNNPFGCSSENAGLSFSAPANTTYYILAAGAYSQSGTLNIVANLSTPPTNDMCANAIPLTNGVTDVTNTFDATEFGDPPTDCNGYPIGHGVWYTVTTPAYDVRLNLSTCGSSYNTELLVYAGVCGSLGNVVACSTGNNPFGCSSENAGLSFSAPANTTYYILAAGAYSQSGTLNIVANLSTPPTNDMCANAIPLTNGVTDVTNTFDATEFGDPATDCNGYPIGHGVWYTLAAFSGQPITISTCGSSYNTELLVYTNGCGSLGKAVACSTGNNPFGCSGENAGLSFSAPATTTYYILVAGAYSQSGALNIVATVPPPPNDTCAGAFAMTPSINYHVNTISATTNGDPVPSCQDSFGNGVWYTITPAVTERLDISTCGSDFGTVMAIYTGACGALTPYRCSDRTSPTCPNEADINFIATGGVKYYILVGGFNDSGGNLQIAANVVLPPMISNISPKIGLTNGGTVVNLSGTGFESGASVSFGSLSASSITVSGGTNIAAVTPPSVAGPVNVVVSNPDGDMVTVTNGFTFIAPPVIQVQPINQTVVDGSNVQFQVQVGGSAPFMYQWYFNAGIMTDNTRITGSQSNVLTLTSVTMSNAGAYLVHVSNAYGSVTSALASLTVIQAIPIVTWSTPAPIDFGVALSTNQLNAAANVPGSFAYNPTLGAVLPVGTNTLFVIFTPTDMLDYSSVTDSVSLVVVPVCDPPPSGLVAWWPAEGNANDIIGGNNGIVQGGTAFTVGEVGSAFSFNGSNAYVQIPNSTSLEPVSLTEEGWFSFSSTDGFQVLMGKPYGSSIDDSFELYYYNGSLAGGSTRPGQTTGVLFASWTPQIGRWYHLAYTLDDTPHIEAVYIDGVQVASRSGIQGTVVYDSHPVLIGCDNDNGNLTSFFAGSADEVSIYNRALSAGEIAAIYSAGNAGKCRPVCTPPPSGLVGWWPGEQNANDIIGGNNGMVQGGTTFAVGEVGSAFSFNGTDAYVQIPDSPDLRPASVTLEAWVKLFSANGTQLVFAKPLGTGVLDSYGMAVVNGVLEAAICDASDFGTFLYDTKTMALGQWYHLAFTFDATTGLETLYTNGAAVASANAGKTMNFDTHPLLFGADIENGVPSYFLNGQIDEASIYNRALTSNEIAAIYNAFSAGKCEAGAPPTILTPPANQLALLGGTIVFSVLANGASPLSYQWLFNSANLTDDGRITGSQSNVLTLISVTMTNSGAYEVVVTNNYGSTNAAAILIVQAVPTVTWTNPAAITYGTALSSNQLDATANVPGSFIYNPANGTVLNAGTNTLSVVFTTSGTLDFIKVTNTVSLTVIPLPVIQTVQQSGGSFTFTWSATTGQMYQIQTASSLYPSNWKTLAGTTITATNSTAAISEPIITTNKSQFYRVVLLQ